MMRIHHVQVGCPPGGEDAARRFYGDVLGWLEVEGAGFPLRWDGDFPGYRRFHTADGNGNRVELLASL